ncbi:MAG TPA: TIGR03016 family PEP-CTERM system-associated outer membrane protein, partial [Gammaproteobacteria bacterium]|nr:TIGR03016 family PEP-CTERM system-associated outer membrane protein [Gammaproteobacteria bacterium]
MRHLVFRSLFLFGYAFFPLIVFSKWDITPSLTLQELYSDNINLNYERNSEFVTEVAPLINFDNKNTLHPIFGFYRVQGLYFAKSNRENRIYQQALVNTQTSFLHRSLKLNAIADHTQQILFPQTEIGVDNIHGSRRSDVSRVMVGPDFIHPLSKWLKSFWSYRYGQVYFHEDNVENSHLQQATWNLGSRNTTHFDFSSNVDWEHTQQDTLRIAESFNAMATLGYRLGPKFRAYAAGGYEEHEGQGLNNALDGTRWHIGAQFAPTRNTFLDGNWGRRSFGETYNLHALWKRKKQSFLLTYQEDITNYF